MSEIALQITIWSYSLNLTNIELLVAAASAIILPLVAVYIHRRLRSIIRHLTRTRLWRPDTQPKFLAAADEHTGLQKSDLGEAIVLESLCISNFKGIKELKLDFTAESTLNGNWTCIAGINGAGKSSILQAMAIVLLGSDLVTELGRASLREMRRSVNGIAEDAEILATVRQGSGRQELYISLSEFGVDEERLSERPDIKSMHDAWSRLRNQLLACYGATRNLSDYIDTRYSRTSLQVQRQMTLFDPAAQLANVKVLLGGTDDGAARETFQRLITLVLDEEDVISKASDDRVSFSQHGAEVGALQLPDGFRSTVAWLADMCAGWHALHPDAKRGVDPEKLSGIVLLDEIGLHLHPSLEGSLVSKLRRALPNIQFIVTTHSPLVLASFDRNELVVLDRDAEEGVRELDRQVFGMTMNDVYEWLMGTSPGSSVVRDLIADGMKEEAALSLYQSKDHNEAEARERLARRREVAKLLREGS